MITSIINGIGIEYDERMWEIVGNLLHFRDSYVGPIDLPDKLESCSHLFEGCEIKEGCYLNYFFLSFKRWNRYFYFTKFSNPLS